MTFFPDRFHGAGRARTARAARVGPVARIFGLGSLALVLAFPAMPAAAQNPGNEAVLEAADALRKRDQSRLDAAHAATGAAKHPLGIWTDYWQLHNRLAQALQTDLDAFYARWPGSYLEDRLRNDWLLELGKRRDWANYRVEYPRFELKDDREASCYWLLTRHLDGDDVKREALAAWRAQRTDDDGCALLATTLYEAKRFTDADVWLKTRLAVEFNRPNEARQAAALLGDNVAGAVREIFADPTRYLQRKASAGGPQAREITALALIRAGARDPEAAAVRLQERWAAELPSATVAWLWASLGKQAAIRLDTAASDHFQRAETSRRNGDEFELPDDTLAWKARAALRANNGAGRWQQLMQAINAMSDAEQRETTWVYWKAHALKALAPDSQAGGALTAEARDLLVSIASPLHFYGKLAMEELGRPLVLPPAPAALTADERAAAAAQPGLQRALLLIELGLRSEGVREWNYSIRGLGDRELLAAAQLACDREAWDRCINTSERTRELVDMRQRFPTPLREAVLARARDTGIDPAYVYGLIRQESRFIMDARSHVGASGLMQLMPATARWTARKLDIDFRPGRINDTDMNLRLGTGYLKLMLDSFEGSQAMAAAGYNAGPNRPRRWREGPVLDAAAWTENIPFGETREYVKKVLSNTTDYAALFSGEPQSLRARLGQKIGPRLTEEPAEAKELP
ncbi:lytic transglycosylase domain-containing protein [Methylibium sp.]|uniref:lytic transglycosylase domain-containing protein n=1 Tax=Methylibium sp. TaxID=2067992 RepID=UPI0018013999|nr:lytic transglycosylase domain-containing protein [Methylibium sp.]MBA3589175.1 lytic transglycosylase domain-containing protein [Methylibium sp.]